MNILYYIGAVIAALGLLIAIHEFGHYWVARRMGVKVLRFSIGFGRPLWQRVAGADRTEYAIGLLPVGGYVKMLDEREGAVAPEELSRAFNRKPLYARTAIVAAGPLFNFLFAIIAYWFIYISGVPGIKPLIGEVAPGSVAELAGVRTGDEIIQVDNQETPTWDAAGMSVVERAMDKEPLTLRLRDETGGERSVTLDTAGLLAQMGKQDLLISLGMRPYSPPLAAIVGDVQEGGVAAQAGLRAGDRILSANGQEIADWLAWVEFVRASPGIPLALQVERDGQLMASSITPAVVSEGSATVGRIGAAPFVPSEFTEKMRAVQRYQPLAAIGAALNQTWKMSVLTLKAIGRMIIGEVSLENLSGPISIVQYAGQSAHSGLTAFLSFLAIFSVSLAVLNLLPIPVLDGGHLLYYGLEFVLGRPLSEQAQLAGQKIGIMILMLLMSIALYNDLMRLF
ncbi:MAG: RIP metalloprotease RseP [Gammaproteobacteria bacterium RBG_16_57_12]|nr:MAG: RIP metalloprotease RseP [Gammaproteobacteria bacterium RBG_16_57_12]